ncbi:hypothetical protein HK101_006542 [Irineochytrium annulatum]|nr:hypothetical protein HK101_006542 [Irineochytrium annulatum]
MMLAVLSGILTVPSPTYANVLLDVASQFMPSGPLADLNPLNNFGCRSPAEDDVTLFPSIRCGLYGVLPLLESAVNSTEDDFTVAINSTSIEAIDDAFARLDMTTSVPWACSNGSRYLAVLDATQDGQLYVVTPAQAGSENPSVPINLDTADMSFFDKYGLSCSDLPRFAGGLDSKGYYANIFYDNAMQKAYIDTTDAVADTDTTTPRLAIFSIQPFARKSLLVDDLCISDPLLCMFQGKIDIMEYLIFQTPTRKSNVTDDPGILAIRDTSAFDDETDGDGWGEINDVVRLHPRNKPKGSWKFLNTRAGRFLFRGLLANKFAKFDLTSSKGLKAVQDFVNTKKCRGDAVAPIIPLMPFSHKGEKSIICVRDNDDAIGAYFVSVYDKSLLTPDVSTAYFIGSQNFHGARTSFR